MKIGILGAGHIAQKMATTLEGIEKTRPGQCWRYAVASRDAAKAAAFAADRGFARSYGSYEEMVSDPEVELVYVATPHSHHFRHMKLAVEHGKPVLCEKAFTANAREARELLAFARERGVFVAEAIWTRYMPFVKTIREIIDSGQLGSPKMLEASLCYPVEDKERVKNPALGGGALLDLGVYCINFARMFFGTDISEIKSVCTKNAEGADISEAISIKYNDGRIASLQAGAGCAFNRKGFIGGTKAYMRIDNANCLTRAEIYDSRDNFIAAYDAPPCINGFEYQVLACEEAISNGRLETPYMPHSEIIAVMEMMDGLRREWGVVFPND